MWRSRGGNFCNRRRSCWTHPLSICVTVHFKNCQWHIDWTQRYIPCWKSVFRPFPGRQSAFRKADWTLINCRLRFMPLRVLADGSFPETAKKPVKLDDKDFSLHDFSPLPGATLLTTPFNVRYIVAFKQLHNPFIVLFHAAGDTPTRVRGTTRTGPSPSCRSIRACFRA